MSTTETRAWTHVTVPMRARMRHLRRLGLSSGAIAVLVADEYGLRQPPCRECVETHAPGGRGRVGMAKGGMA